MALSNEKQKMDTFESVLPEYENLECFKERYNPTTKTKCNSNSSLTDTKIKILFKLHPIIVPVVVMSTVSFAVSISLIAIFLLSTTKLMELYNVSLMIYIIATFLFFIEGIYEYLYLWWAEEYNWSPEGQGWHSGVV